jgi:hypothetical protein
LGQLYGRSRLLEGGLIQDLEEDAQGELVLATRHVGQRIVCLVVRLLDVGKLKAVKLPFQLAHLLAVCLHRRIMAIHQFHDLTHDQRRVAEGIEALNAE